MKLKGWVFSRREKGKKEKGIQALFFALEGRGLFCQGNHRLFFFFLVKHSGDKAERRKKVVEEKRLVFFLFFQELSGGKFLFFLASKIERRKGSLSFILGKDERVERRVVHFRARANFVLLVLFCPVHLVSKFVHEHCGHSWYIALMEILFQLMIMCTSHFKYSLHNIDITRSFFQ